MIALWIVAAVVFLIIEAITAAMNSIWFVAGSLAALAGAALGAPIWAQVLLFAAVSGVCFAILYPMECVVTQRIDNLAGTGAVSVGGKTWSARSADGQTFDLGQVVVADSIQGVKLMVSPARETAHS